MAEQRLRVLDRFECFDVVLRGRWGGYRSWFSVLRASLSTHGLVDVVFFFFAVCPGSAPLIAGAASSV
jgi:hypothetical protein